MKFNKYLIEVDDNQKRQVDTLTKQIDNLLKSKENIEDQKKKADVNLKIATLRKRIADIKSKIPAAEKTNEEADDKQRIFLQVERRDWNGKIDDLIESEFNVSISNFRMPNHINNYINKMLGRLLYRKASLGDKGNEGEIRIKLAVG